MKEDLSYLASLLIVFAVNVVPSHLNEFYGLGELLLLLGPTSIIMYDVTVLFGAFIIGFYNYIFKVSGLVSLVIGMILLIFCLVEFQYGVLVLSIRYTTVVFTCSASLIIGSLPFTFYYSFRRIRQRLIRTEEYQDN